MEKCERQIHHGLGIWKKYERKPKKMDWGKFGKEKENAWKMEKLEKPRENLQNRKTMEKSETLEISQKEMGNSANQRDSQNIHNKNGKSLVQVLSGTHP